MPRTVAFALALVFLAAGLCGPARGARQPQQPEVTAAQLQQRIDTLAARVRAAQQPDGSLMGRGQSQWIVGQTALGVLALRAAGAPPDDHTVQAAIEFLSKHKVGNRGVYETSLRLMAMESVNPAGHRDLMVADATNLVSWQNDDGGWGYPVPKRADCSNTQFALLGLNAAALSGLRVPDAVWQNALRYFASRQANDGGWGYQGPSSPTGSMTAAGVTGMYLCDLWLHVSTGRCGVYPDERPIAGGLQWLAKHFSVTRNPGTSQWKFYYLYALERTGVILAQRYFGGFDWYREGVQHLVGDPESLVAAGAGSNEWPYLRDCFMLLFLAKGNAPILLHKAQWTGAWNVNRLDARFLIEYVGRQLDQRLDWQVTPAQRPPRPAHGRPHPLRERQREALLDRRGAEAPEAVRGCRRFRPGGVGQRRPRLRRCLPHGGEDRLPRRQAGAPAGRPPHLHGLFQHPGSAASAPGGH